MRIVVGLAQALLNLKGDVALAASVMCEEGFGITKA
jgi:hypothetical protein